jgi:acetylornithine deacetylase/succinyl-diaminopimelate desuccinylase-like protein
VSLDLTAARRTTDELWADEIVPALHDFIRIPNVSPAFDPDWADHGHMDRAVALVRDWCAAHAPAGATVEVHELAGRTPVVLVAPPPPAGAPTTGTVLLYGHLDKQPPMTGWRSDLGPWEPRLEGDRLYGRGGADDGYSAFAAVAALRAVETAGGEHGRCVVLIEASEESGSPDLPAQVEALADRLGPVDLVIALDSGCGDYERLWVSTSLRGVVDGALRVGILTEGVHSGMSCGAPDSFRIARRLLDRVEDTADGRVLVPELHADIPPEREQQLAAAAAVLDPDPAADLPLVPGARPDVDDVVALLRRRTWEPTLTVLAAEGLPAIGDGGAVLRPATSLELSFRLPPTIDPGVAAAAVTRILTVDAPFGADVSFELFGTMRGWDAPPTAPWLAAATDAASRATFGRPAAAVGIGGSIPFMAMLGERFPAAQFLVTGVLGPGSNAHGPNEFLHVPTGRHVTVSVAAALHAHATQAEPHAGSTGSSTT